MADQIHGYVLIDVFTSGARLLCPARGCGYAPLIITDDSDSSLSEMVSHIRWAHASEYAAVPPEDLLSQIQMVKIAGR